MAAIAALLIWSSQLTPQVDLGQVVDPQGTRLEGLDELGPVAAPDLDGDGVVDFVLGAPVAHHGGSYSGSVYVLFGPLTPSYALRPEDEYVANGLRIDGLQAHDALGRSVARVGDVNGDGVEDLAFAGNELLYVLFGGPQLRGTSTFDLATLDGTNGFRLSTALPGTMLAHAVAAVGDVNDDGFQDFALGLPGKDDPWTSLSFAPDVRATAMGDLDGDGDQDLLVSEGDYDTISILLNPGDGTYSSRTTLVLPESRELHLHDLDHDGDLDLVAEFEKFLAGGVVEGSFAVFRNLGGGTFALIGQHRVDAVGRDVEVTIGDLDGDGDEDVVGINFQANAGTPTNPVTAVSTFLNDGSGSFTLRATRQFSYHSQHVALIDVEGDGDRDILVATDRIVTPTSPRLRFHPNDGSGGIGTGLYFDVLSFATTLIVADVNGDGHEDLFTQRSWFPGSAIGLRPRVDITYQGRPFVGEGLLADTDSNGSLDFVVGDDSDGVLLHPNDGVGGFGAQQRTWYAAVRGQPACGDIDGDGDGDLVVAERTRVWTAFNRGDGSFGGASSGGAFVVFGGPALGAAGGVLDLDLLDGSDGFRISGAEAGANLGRAVTPAGDMNSDGLPDLALAAPFLANGRGELYVLYGAVDLGAGGSLEVSAVTAATGLRVPGVEPFGFCRTVVGGLDLDGDGRKDLVCGGPNFPVQGVADSGRIVVIYGRGALVSQGTFDLTQLGGGRGYSISGSPGGFLGVSLLGIGDYDGDGCDDLAAAATSDDTGGIDRGATYVFLGGRRSTQASLPASRHPGSVLRPQLDRSRLGLHLAAGDWNDDGRTDLYLWSPPFSPGAPSPGSVHVLFDVDRVRFRRQWP